MHQQYPQYTPSHYARPTSPYEQQYQSQSAPYPLHVPFQQPDFEIERSAANTTPGPVPHQPIGAPSYVDEGAIVAQLLLAKSRPTTVSGTIPVDPASLVLFYRSKVSINYYTKINYLN